MSRLAHRAFFLTEEERTRAVELMRRVEEFSGVIVLAYAFLQNHFHIFIYVPEIEEIGDEEILRRVNILYRGTSLNQMLATWNRLSQEEEDDLAVGIRSKDYVSRFAKYKDAFLRRMWNSSEFMRTFKQHFTMSYNGRREHVGTMWEGRYTDRSHLPQESIMWNTAAYVDANPVKAGFVEWPDCYPWCSFAAACGGDELARRGYAFMYGASGGWQVIREKHEISIREALAEINPKRGARVDGSENTDVRRSISKYDPQLPEPKKDRFGLVRGEPMVAERILEELKRGPLRAGALRDAVGIKSRIHFIRYYIEPLLEQGYIERTDPERPCSPQQRYRRVK